MGTNIANGQPVVVGIDGSETALGAAQWAARYAAQSGSPLVLLHAVARLDWHFLVEPPTPADSGESAADSVLSAAGELIRSEHPDLVIRTATVKKSVTEALQENSEEARMLVVGAGTDSDVLGRHVVRIAHRALSPVLVWRPAAAHRTGRPLPVVVGIDESEHSQRALTVAFETAHLLHAPITVVHMWEIAAAVGLGYSQGLMDWQLLDQLQTEQRQRMDELVAPLARKYPNTHASEIFRDISPAKGLRELSGDAQLVVVGSHGSGRIATSILGSVSQNVVHHAECPVLVVH